MKLIVLALSAFVAAPLAAQVVKAPFSGDNKKGNGTVKTGNDLRGSKNK